MPKSITHKSQSAPSPLRAGFRDAEPSSRIAPTVRRNKDATARTRMDFLELVPMEKGRSPLLSRRDMQAIVPKQIARERRARLRFDDSYYTRKPTTMFPIPASIASVISWSMAGAKAGMPPPHLTRYTTVMCTSAEPVENPLLHFVDKGEALGLKTRTSCRRHHLPRASARALLGLFRRRRLPRVERVRRRGRARTLPTRRLAERGRTVPAVRPRALRVATLLHPTPRHQSALSLCFSTSLSR